jgi:hypothetical protein
VFPNFVPNLPSSNVAINVLESKEIELVQSTGLKITIFELWEFQNFSGGLQADIQ